MASSFKSVGELSTDRKFQTSPNEIPIGIKTPLSLGQKSDGIFSMHFTLSDQIQDNFRNLLLTNHGERLGFYDFGANLRSLAFELAPDQFETEAMRRIKSAVSKYMPYLVLQTFEHSIDHNQNENVAKIRLRIVYDIPRLNVQSKGIELSFFVGG